MLNIKFQHLISLLLVSLPFLPTSCAQHIPKNKPSVQDPAFDDRLSRIIPFEVPLMSIDTLEKRQDEVVLLDTREKEEYQVSHIRGARHVGYRNFDKTKVNDIPKDRTIVLYCSVGYRSDKIGQQLQEMGYQKVYNLYGSIFEWVNQGNPVYNEQGKAVDIVHAYNQRWSQWIKNDKIKKTW